MLQQLLYFVIMAAAMMSLSMSNALPGFRVDGWGSALVASLVLAAANTILKPILFVLTLPFTILTLGLFLLVLNAIVLWLVSLVVPGFHLDGFLPAFLAALVLSVVGMVWKGLTKDGRKSD